MKLVHQGQGETFVRATIGAGLYFLVASISLPLSIPGAIISPLWPPAGLALFFCLHWGRRMVPAIWIGASFAFLWRGWDPLPAAITASASALAAWAASMLLDRLQREGTDFIYSGNVFRFLLVALSSGLISAPLAVGGAMLGQRLGPEPWLAWLTWTLGTATGMVIVTPLLRAWRVTSGIRWSRAKKIEALAFLMLFPTVTHIAFSDVLGAWPLPYLPIPFVIWAAYRFNLPAVTWSTALVCVVAALNTLRGDGPFAIAHLNTALLLLVIYVSVIGVIGLTLASLIYQRAEAETQLKHERDNLEQRVLNRTDALSAELQERRRVERQLAEAQRLAQIGSWNWDVEDNSVTWSEQLYRIYGVDRNSFALAPHNWLRLVHPDDRDKIRQAFRTCRRDGAPFAMEHRIRFPEGDIRIVAARGEGARDVEGRVTNVFGTVQDVTESRLAEAALREAQERYRLVVELSPEAIVVEQERTIVFVNPAAVQLLGARHPDQVVGKSIFEFLHPDYHAIAEEHAARLKHEGSLLSSEKRLVRPDGREIEVEVSASRFTHHAVFALLYIMRDITERKRSAEQLARLAHFDSLTGLPNRPLFDERLAHALSIAARPGRSLELLFLDLDHFKQINDTLGHATGDLVLQEAAVRLQTSLRESDTVARLGGDEFVVLVENVDEPHRGGTIAEKILAAFSRPFLSNTSSLQIGASIGIATFPNDGTDANTLLKRADMAMYLAKQQGRNSYRYYSSDLNQQTSQRRSLEQALRKAIERGEMSLHYQPRYDIVSGKLIGMETLLRWNNPELGVIPPMQFIPLAEERGMMTEIGYWTVRRACGQAREWQSSGATALTVSVNLSRRQLTDPWLIKNIESILAETGLAACHLEVEITEEAIMSEPDKTLRVLSALREAQIGVTIDDFGTGYSSLDRLKQYPMGSVKIDRSFVRGIPQDHRGAAVTRAIIGLAHNLGWNVVAQGAETRQQFDFLREHSCDSVQGYYFSGPMPAEHFKDLIDLHSNVHLN